METNPRQAKVTMQDVANHVGVSRTTVSFVLNGGTGNGIPEETRDRVHQAVSELGYRPNAGARALASKQTKLYGLITEIVIAPYAANIVRGAEEQAAREGKTLLIASTDGSSDADRRAIETMLEHRVEGLIYATSWHRGVRLPAVAEEVPTVLVHCFDEATKLHSVIPDEAQGGYVATMRLIGAGHDRIGLINLDPVIPAAIGRRAGYVRALEQAGIGLDESLVINEDGEADQGYRAAVALLDLADRLLPRSSAATTGWRWVRTTPSRNGACASPRRRRGRLRQPGTHRRLPAAEADHGRPALRGDGRHGASRCSPLSQRDSRSTPTGDGRLPAARTLVGLTAKSARRANPLTTPSPCMLKRGKRSPSWHNSILHAVCPPDGGQPGRRAPCCSPAAPPERSEHRRAPERPPARSSPFRVRTWATFTQNFNPFSPTALP